MFFYFLCDIMDKNGGDTMNSCNITLSCKKIGQFDLVVIGGGCTGVFAAVRAARLGLKVAVVLRLGSEHGD